MGFRVCMNTVFYISAAVAVLATLLVITRLNAVHALLYLIVSLLAVAVIFYALGAPFVAALEVLIYAGAIMVLFVFVIMTLNVGAPGTEPAGRRSAGRAWIGPVVLACICLTLWATLAIRLSSKSSRCNPSSAPQP